MRKRATCEGSCTEWRPSKRSREISLGGAGGGRVSRWNRVLGRGAGRRREGQGRRVDLLLGLRQMRLRGCWPWPSGEPMKGAPWALVLFSVPFCFIPVAGLDWLLCYGHLFTCTSGSRIVLFEK